MSCNLLSWPRKQKTLTQLIVTITGPKQRFKPYCGAKYVSSSDLTTQTFYLLPSISLDAASPLECNDLVGESN